MPKSTPNPLAKRKFSSASPISTPRTKSGPRKSKIVEKDHDRLDDFGSLTSIAVEGLPKDVVSLIQHILETRFEDPPERGAGMNGTQMTRCLRSRDTLPPVVSVAHLHALTRSGTETDRELARLIAEGKVRRIQIPGRGTGGSATSDAVAVVQAWQTRLLQDTTLDDDTKRKYIALMTEHPTSRTVPVGSLTKVEVRSLVAAGFLTNPGSLCSNNGGPMSMAESTGSIERAGSSAASGTLAAVGGYAAIHSHGGGGNMLATKVTRPLVGTREEMTLSLPSMGAYLKLLTESRMHMLSLLKQLSPRYKEATWDMIVEQWNGNIPNDAISRAKRLRGQWTGVLPGQTKKFSQFNGLRGEWVLEECIGSGTMQLFQTGSVGLGVRGM